MWSTEKLCQYVTLRSRVKEISFRRFSKLLRQNMSNLQWL
jgi:hypothetical protein